LDATAVTSTGTITIDCNESQHVVIGIGPSPNSGGFTPRQMLQTSGGSLLDYNLYTASDMTIIWGDGTQGSSTIFVNVKKNKPQDTLVYGQIPAGQDVSVGSYSESLLVTVNF
jgi:spore coat protein U-like protein